MSKEAMKEAAEAIAALREWIEAVPDDVQLPAMPGTSGDWLDQVESKLKIALAEQPAQPQSCYCPNCEVLSKELAAQRTWVGLTDNEIENLWHEFYDREFGWARRFTRAIEAKLKENNT